MGSLTFVTGDPSGSCGFTYKGNDSAAASVPSETTCRLET